MHITYYFTHYTINKPTVYIYTHYTTLLLHYSRPGM